jgi:hypothetical protein
MNFNSTKVRLKVRAAFYTAYLLSHFNSTKVRLKANKAHDKIQP